MHSNYGPAAVVLGGFVIVGVSCFYLGCWYTKKQEKERLAALAAETESVTSAIRDYGDPNFQDPRDYGHAEDTVPRDIREDLARP